MWELEQGSRFLTVAAAVFDGCLRVFVLGNDLARVLHWGPGYHGEAEPLSLLRDVIDAEEIKLDR